MISRAPVLLAIASLSLACVPEPGAAPPAPDVWRGELLSSALIDRFTLDELNERLSDRSPLITAAVEAEFGVDVHRVVYATIDVRGGRTHASGVVAVPRDAHHALPLLSYQHGTLLRKHRAPSLRDDGERVVVLGTAGAGYLAAAPDYLGLGLGEGFHPYIHADSEASATLDMLRAARHLAGSLGARLSGDVFLLGYSQGGHATMATARLIETTPALREEMRLAAVAPMAGPYDVSGVQAEVIVADAPYPDPSYLPYILLGYDAVYDLFDDVTEVIDEPWATSVRLLFDGRHGPGDVNARLPDVPKRILSKAELRAFEARFDHPLRLALADNDVTDWTPRVPLRMYHCEADRHVAFANAEVALARFIERGARDVELVSMGVDLDHEGCVLPSLTDAKVWFDGFVRGP